VRATTVSRRTNGLLLIPQEISFPAAEPAGDDDAQVDPFIEDLTEHLVAQVEQAGSAAAAAPYLIQASYEYLDRVRWMQMHDSQNDYAERDLRKEAVERLARGFDMPVEVLLGLGSTNHWAARQILDDMWKSHGAPVAEQWCDELTEVFLRPGLREAGYDGWRQVVIGYDESQVVVKPDRSDDADKAHDRGAIGDPGYRVMKNIPESYAQTDEERERWLAIKLRNPQLLPGVDIEPVPEEGPPPPGPEGDSGRRTRVTASAGRELGAAEMALLRCRELAGIRIRQKEKLCPDCLTPANGKPNALVASLVGEHSLAQMHVDPTTLVRGGADSLKTLLADWGYPPTQASALGEMIEVYAARTLFNGRQPELPAAFRAHLEQVREFVGDGKA
jgi:hypothetical protein